MGKTGNERALAGRIGGYVTAARHDSRVNTAPAQQAAAESLYTRLVAEVDPRDELAPEERERRLQAARSAHFAKLAHQRHQAEAAKRAAGGGGA